MSFGSLLRGLAQFEGAQVLATLSRENPNFAWKVCHFSIFLTSWFLRPQQGIDNPPFGMCCAMQDIKPKSNAWLAQPMVVLRPSS